MNTGEDILEEAITKLEGYSGFKIRNDQGLGKDKYIAINGTKFNVTIVKEITKGNKGVLLNLIHPLINETDVPFLLVTKYIPNDIAFEYVNKYRVNYLDLAGNCHIRTKDFFILIEGKKREKAERKNQSRAFQEAGIKIIFYLLNNPENINLPYRAIATESGVSLASVGYVLQELTELSFFMKTKKGNFLKNQKELLNRWVIAYHEVLRPRLFLKKMRFMKREKNEWSYLPIKDAQDLVLWGGEPAGALMTNYLFPAAFTLYTDGVWKTLINDLELVPSEYGEIEILKIFWIEKDTSKKTNTVPPLLVYADLVGTGNDRNIETAKIILENELSHIQ
ncbi:type IV toxin-antitoxin system AbiEi family antitoxin [Flavobacterium sp.]|uniref:type IV toxin-antitoxin system AbiEi family antitoxin n=1 Tax=Flavobacterium TaxID=237 RepID=UPI0031D0EB3B